MKKYILIFIMLFSHNAFARDGTSLLESCGQARVIWSGAAGNKEEAMYCFGMLNGIVATLVISANSSNNFGICDKNNTGKFIPLGDAIKVVHNFLENNTNRLMEPDAVLAIHALRQSYPCNNENKANK